jgi:ABC-2 type transport system permease protein
VSVVRVWQVLRKDLRLGPRSPILLWALVVPVLITVLVRGVFGGLFDEAPRLGIVDQGASAVTSAVQDRPGVDVHLAGDVAALRADVLDGRLDAGLVLPAGFDAAVRGGQQPPLQLWLSGASYRSNRAVLTATVLDVVRGLTGDDAPVEVVVVIHGEEVLPLDLRMLPLIVMYAVAIPGGMVPAASLVEEKERGTIQAMLVTPVSIGEVLAAKGALGVLLASIAGLVTLLLNDAFGASPLAMLCAVLVGATMMALIGLLFGAWASDTNTLFAAWKGGGIILFLPAVFFVWPGLPSWPPLFMPTYYFLEPAFAVSVEGATFAHVAPRLAIGVGICLTLVPAVAAAGRSLSGRLSAGRVEATTQEQPA